MTLKEPYFMNNKEWYSYDFVNFKYILTEKAPKKAILNYNNYYSMMQINA